MPDTGWTVDTLHAHFTALNAATEKATENTKLAMEKRLDGMNEFRGQLKDQNAEFVRLSEYKAGMEQLAVLQRAFSRLLGGLTMVGLIIGVLIAAAGTISGFMNHQAPAQLSAPLVAPLPPAQVVR